MKLLGNLAGSAVRDKVDQIQIKQSVIADIRTKLVMVHQIQFI